MRRSRVVLSGAVGLMLAQLVFCSDSEACWRGRRQQMCSPCAPVPPCASPMTLIPHWARWIPRNVPHCPPGYSCKCCSGGVLINCDGGANCDEGSMMCVKDGVSVSCAQYHGSWVSDPFGGSVLWAMNCDCTFHVLRFSLPWEVPDGYFPLRYLGRECHYTK
jgi:hypothetical protein